MTTIAIDGMNEEEFRRSIESKLRHGRAGEAVDRLRALLEPFAGPGKTLPHRFLTITAEDLSFNGWDALSDALRRHDRPGRPVTALSIAFGWPGEDVPQPDAEGRLSPFIEAGYYTDDAFPFSQSGRDDLLDGYSYHGCTWTGDCEATDTALWLSGIDDLHGALAMLEARLLASEEPDEEGIRAGSLGACLLSVLLFQAVDARVAQGGLPRPLCIMAGSSGVYPYFDAPVAGFPVEARKASEGDEEEALNDAGVPGPRYSSLLVTGIPRAQKRAVLVLEETADEEALRIGRLRGLANGETFPEPAQPEAEPEVPAANPAEAAIAPAMASPLMTKKAPGQAWDFREMLSSYDPEADPPGDEQFEPEQDWGGGAPPEPEPDWDDEPPAELEPDWGGDDPSEPEPDWGDPAPFEPAAEPLPVLSGSSAGAPVGPGFSLLDVLREDRQLSILPLPAFHTIEDEAEAEDEPVLPAAAEPEPVTPPATEEFAEPEPTPLAAVEPAPSVWPLDPGWLQEVEARILPKAPQNAVVTPQPASVEPAESKSLLARLRDWWNGRR